MSLLVYRNFYMSNFVSYITYTVSYSFEQFLIGRTVNPAWLA